MKNSHIPFLIMFILGILGSSHSLFSQGVYKINDSKDIDMKLSGTSTLHKWSMDAKTFEGTAQFGFAPGNDRHITSVQSLSFALEVQNLKSDEKGLDKNAYKALKTDRFKDIFYKLLSAEVMPEKDSKYLIRTLGNLSIAGVTKEVIMDVYCAVDKDATISCSGASHLNMTDYQVKPPSFMLGAMKTGDAITLDFTLVYKK